MREAVRSRSGERGRGRRGGILACVLLSGFAALLLASSASALSQRGHVFSGSFGIEAGGGVQLKEPAGVAVNETTGNIYVVDSGNNRVVEFNAEHHFLRTWGWGVTDGAKSFETCVSACRAGIAGHTRGQLHGAEDIAVDNSKSAGDPSAGDVYVETVLPYEEEVEGHTKEFEGTVIEKFGPNGELLAKGGRIKGFKAHGESAELFEEEVHGLTVGSAGTLYVYNEESIIEYTNEAVNKFKGIIESEAGEGRHGIAVDTNHIIYAGVESEDEAPAGAEPPTVIAKEFVLEENGKRLGEPLFQDLTAKESSGVSVDFANNNALVDNVTSVGVWAPTSEPDEPAERFGEGHIQHGRGLAAPRNGEVLVADAGSNQIDVFGLEPPAAPQIGEQSVSNITPTGAELHADINPTGPATTYVFRYDTGAVAHAGEACTESCVEVPAPAGNIAAGFGDTEVSQELKGLTANTVYHWRAIAFNENAPAGVESAEHQFRTVLTSSAVLPDGRRWEVVSPLKKNGAAIQAPTREGGLIEASENGERVTYVALGSFPEAEGNRAPEPTQVLAVRGEKDWFNRDIDQRQKIGLGLTPGRPVEYRFFSPDLTSALLQPDIQHQFEAAPLDEEPEEGQDPKHESTPYVRHLEPSCLAVPAPFVCFSPLVTPANAPAEREFAGKKEANQFGGQIEFVESDTTFKHLILRTKSNVVLSAAPGAVENLYEQSEGQNTLVSVLPAGGPAKEPQLGAFGQYTQHALSADGSRVVWAATEGGVRHLYLRDVPKGETLRIDAPQPGAEPDAPSVDFAPVYQAASADDSHIFFTDQQRLTTNSSASHLKASPDLFECAVVENASSHKLECKLTDLSPDPNIGEPANVQGLIPGAGEDAKTVYFVANGALAAGAPAGHCREGDAGGEFRTTTLCNLYVESYDSGTESWSSPRLVATLSGEDGADWRNTLAAGSKGETTARVSNDGNLLAFMSDRNLTGYNNVDLNSGKPDTEVYQYNAVTDHLTCVSCNPFGRRPTGVFDFENAGEGLGRLVDRPIVWQERWISGNIPTWTHVGLTNAPYLPRYLFNDGRTFFMSAEALVPQDVNGKEDVYEYEPAGVGGCTTESETYGEQSGGCVSLISSGTSTRESAFLDASASGNDAFFMTSEPLAPADIDQSYDVYDATICGQPGSHACLPAPVISPPPCESLDGCRGGSTGPGEQFAAPGTATSKGSPNSTEVLEFNEHGEPKLTNAQLLAKGLAACRKISNHGKRQACELKSTLKYGTKGQKLNASLKSCHAVKSHKKRQACEKAAHKKYGAAKKAAAHGAGSKR